MRAILILEQGHEKMIIPGTDMCRLLLGKGARVLDLAKTPPGHLAVKVDEYGVATEANGSTAFTVTVNLQCEETPVLIKEAPDVEPTVGQPAPSDAGAPAPNDAHTYDVPEHKGHQSLHQRGDAFLHDPVY
eukprot:5171341-Pyramimonas_sp.AAC.1